MRRSLVILFVAALVAAAASAAILAATPGNPQNGLGTAADVNATGCTDCHTKAGGVDNSLAAVVKKSAPKHSMRCSRKWTGLIPRIPLLSWQPPTGPTFSIQPSSDQVVSTGKSTSSPLTSKAANIF